MTSFLNHLAGLALGVKPAGAARLSLPSRFAPSSLAIGPGPQGLEPVEEAVRPPSAQINPALAPAGSSDRRAPDGEVARGENPVAHVERNPVAHMERRGEGSTERPLAQVFSQPAPALAPKTGPNMQDVALPPRPLAGPADTVRFATGASLPVVDQPRAQPLPDPRAPLAPTPSRLASDPPHSHQVTPAAPLSAAIVSARTPAHEDRPVIHVTIDRIEVRSPAPPKPAVEQRRARSQPSVSLSDYLRESGGRG